MSLETILETKSMPNLVDNGERIVSPLYHKTSEGEREGGRAGGWVGGWAAGDHKLKIKCKL